MSNSIFLKQLKTLIKRRQHGIENNRRIIMRFIFWLNKWRYPMINIMDEDWKYLIILDACRFDSFRDENFIPGILDKRYSAGTSTIHWMMENFNESYPDVIYVSANPLISDTGYKKWLGKPHPFFKIENVWSWGWNEEIGTVHPSMVNKAVLKLLNTYREKRMIIHYMQPHFPYLGDVSIKHMQDIEGIELLKLLRKGKVDVEDVKVEYIENLRIVLKYVKDLLKYLPPSKIIISSDHGECFGEYGIFFHPPKLYLRTLLEVPWLEIN